LIPLPGRSSARLSGVFLLLLSIASGVRAESAHGKVHGKVSVDLPGVTVSRLVPIVVFLTPLNHTLPAVPVPPAVEIRQKDARFSPSFRAIVKGQTVDMPNVDTIYHNVFSFSRPNDFELGTYPVGESRSVTFEHAGVVKTYCSIHESMNATIFVAPNPFFSVVAANGRVAIEGIPAGRFRLEAWSEKLPKFSREIVVAAGAIHELTVPIVATGS